MKITEITYSRTVNRGYYNSEKVEMKASLAEGEEHQTATLKLRNEVNHALGFAVDPVEADTTPEALKTKKVLETPVEEKKTTKKVAKKTTKKTTKKAAKKVEAEVVEEKAGIITLAEVQAQLKAVAKSKGLSAAKDILRELDVDKSSELKEEQFATVVKECLKCLK